MADMYEEFTKTSEKHGQITKKARDYRLTKDSDDLELLYIEMTIMSCHGTDLTRKCSLCADSKEDYIKAYDALDKKLKEDGKEKK